MRSLLIVSAASIALASFGCSAEAVDCATLDTVDCAAQSNCAVKNARRYDEANACYEAEVPAICFRSSDGCDQAETPASDPDGRCWRFKSGCPLPDGWTAEEADACPALDDTPTCE